MGCLAVGDGVFFGDNLPSFPSVPFACTPSGGGGASEPLRDLDLTLFKSTLSSGSGSKGFSSTGRGKSSTIVGFRTDSGLL